MKTTYTLLAATMLTSTLTCAQAQTTTTDDNIETIHVYGSSQATPKALIAGSSTIINVDTIKASGALNITDLLRTVAGVNISQSGPSGALTELRFRGSESNHVMVLLDGVEINDLSQGGLVDFSHILLSNIARIEILRGPQSALWGSNAIAGIINISSAKSQNQGSTARAGLSLGDRSTMQANAGMSYNKNALSLGLSTNIYKTNGENISRSGNEADGYKNTSVVGNIGYRFSETNRIDINARFVDFDADADGFDFSTGVGIATDADINAKGEQLSTALNWHFRPNAESFYSQLLSVQYAQQETINYNNSFLDTGFKGSKLRVLWNNRFDLQSNTWVNLGLESVNEDYKQSGVSIFGDPNQKRSNNHYSLVSSAQYAVLENVNLSASYRYDNNDSFDNAASYRFGATYIINTNWHTFVSMGEALKNPTYTERFGFFPGQFIGNPNLTPETQQSIEAGFEGRLDNISLQVSWFKAELENEILGFVFDPISGGFTAGNANEDSQREGLELSINGSVGDIDYKAQYSYLDASDVNASEIRRARHTASISANYLISDKHSVYLQSDYVGTRFDLGNTALNPYWLVSGNYRYQYSEALNLNARFSNILNHQYEDIVGYSAESSRVLLNLQYTW